MPRTCRFQGNYNVAKKLKSDTKTIMTNRKKRRAQLKKDQTRRRKNRKPKTLWSEDKRAEMARTIMSLGTKYVMPIYNLVCTYEYEDMLGGTVDLRDLRDDTLWHLDWLLRELVKEKEMVVSEDYRSRMVKKMSNTSEEIQQKIYQIYKKAISARFNKMHQGDEMDFAFPFPLKSLKEIEVLIKKDKKHQYYLSRKR